MANTISNSDNVIDSRDVIARIEELEELEALEGDDENPMDESDIEELKTLRALQEDAAGYSEDWKYGTTLIRDSYFKEYAQELAEDIGAINKDATWPNTCIDWDQAARELQQDYTSVTFDGIDYWVR